MVIATVLSLLWPMVIVIVITTVKANLLYPGCPGSHLNFQGSPWSDIQVGKQNGSPHPWSGNTPCCWGTRTCVDLQVEYHYYENWLDRLSYQNFTPRDNLGKADLAWRKEEGLMPTGTNVVKGGQVCGASTHLNVAILTCSFYFQFWNISMSQYLSHSRSCSCRW